MPPVVQTTRDTPYQDGTQTQQVRFGAREMDIPIEIWGSDFAGAARELHHLIRQFNPKAGVGQYVVIRSDGQQRVLNCRYLKGLEGDEPQEYGWGFVARRVLTLHADDPFWYEPTNTVLAGPAFTGVINASGPAQTSATVTVTNNGDIDVYPIYTLAISLLLNATINIQFNNITTGRSFTITTGPGAITFVVDGRPTKKTIMVGSGSAFPSFVAIDFPPLAVGANVLQLTITNQTPGTLGQLVMTTSVDFTQGYLSL